MWAMKPISLQFFYGELMNTKLNVMAFDRLNALVAIFCMQLLCSADVLGRVPINEYMLAAKAMLEVLSILIFMRLGNEKIHRFMVAVSFAGLTLRLFLLWAYFFDGTIYSFLHYQEFSKFSGHTLYFAALLRLGWMGFVDGKIQISEFPEVEFFPTQKNSKKQFMAIISQIFLFVISAEIVILLTIHDVPWLNLVPASIGILLLIFKGKAFRDQVSNNLAMIDKQILVISEKNAQLEKYEIIIGNLAEKINQNVEPIKKANVFQLPIKENDGK
jgi:hypothetical protein